MADRRTVQLKVGGQTYRVVTTADENELARLAQTVDARMSAVTPKGKTITPQAMLLAALSLAHELEEERDRRSHLERRTRDLLRRVLVRIDGTLDG